MILLLTASALLIVSELLTAPSVGWWAVKLSVFYLGIPLFILYIGKKDPRKYGLTLKNWKRSVLYFLIVLTVSLPIMLYGSSLESFQQYYPLFSCESLPCFAKNELFIGIVMLSTEFFFRGFLMFELRKSIGWYAILVQAIPYGFIHIGKPTIELYYSFFAGIVLGYMDYKTESILPSFLSHYIPAIIFDILCF